MTPPELEALLRDFHRDLSTLFIERQERARSVAAYDANNAYQQVLARQDTHLRWVEDAITDMGAAVGSAAQGQVSQAQPADKRTPSADRLRGLLRQDVDAQRVFISTWRPRVATASHARNRLMLELILGEMLEHLRAFEQALGGRTDVLGRHADGKVLSGEVLPARPK